MTFFQMRKFYNGLRATLTVDLEAKAAEVVIAYHGKIQRMETVNLWEVDTPEKANAWMSRPMGERGNFIERLEWMARSGILKPRLASV